MDQRTMDRPRRDGTEDDEKSKKQQEWKREQEKLPPVYQTRHWKIQTKSFVPNKPCYRKGDVIAKIKDLGRTLSPQQILENLSPEELAVVLGLQPFARKAKEGPVTMPGWSAHRQARIPWDTEEATQNYEGLGIGRLPGAIWQEIFGYLGFRDLGRLMQSCRLIRGNLQEWDLWHDLCANVGMILNVLRAAFILDLHSPQTVHDTLSDGNCSHCNSGFGGFVNLLSLKRACSSCARDVYEQWTLDSETLCTAFALDAAQISDLPTMRRIPAFGEEVTPESLPFARRKLLLLSDVRNRALAVHGGQRGLEAAVTERYGQFPSDSDQLTVKHLHLIHVDSEQRHSLIPLDDIYDLNGFDGKSNGHVTFPFLAEPGREPDAGHFCRACEIEYVQLRGDGNVVAAAGMNGVQEEMRPGFVKADQEHSLEAFAAHVTDPEACPFAAREIEQILSMPEKPAPKRREGRQEGRREGIREGRRDGRREGRYRDSGYRDSGYRDVGYRDGGYRDGGYRGSGRREGRYRDNRYQDRYRDDRYRVDRYRDDRYQEDRYREGGYRDGGRDSHKRQRRGDGYGYDRDAGDRYEDRGFKRARYGRDDRDDFQQRKEERGQDWDLMRPQGFPDQALGNPELFMGDQRWGARW